MMRLHITFNVQRLSKGASYWMLFLHLKLCSYDYNIHVAGLLPANM